ncbi:hypothetical protein GIB67_042613 [Kingdonia uniflora]|uniref:Uncharacterized protein n=1 Tax=Kingdonia uniflora TaxID=39325 RepID=A0A7J7M1H9_9MAGN|nr:hypothetical protein GIB67_042613 [Kingdonia uniflora]
MKDDIQLKRVLDEQCALAFADLPGQLDAKEILRQALKKTLASKGTGDMEDPTFEELFEQNKRFFTIPQQGPKEDY